MTLAVTQDHTAENADRAALSRDEMARVVARDIPYGSYVNLGIGQPTKVADYLELGSGVILHTENGMLGMGPIATGDQIDPDLTNAGKQPVANRDLWERLIAETQRHDVIWHKVKGHSGEPLNERVDALARAAIGERPRRP